VDDFPAFNQLPVAGVAGTKLADPLPLTGLRGPKPASFAFVIYPINITQECEFFLLVMLNFLYIPIVKPDNLIPI
jgi:hypothetical protein